MKPYYEEAGITIYHGDCREVLPTLGGRFDLLLTDPPYGIGYAANPVLGKNRASKPHVAREWDDSPVPDIGIIITYADDAVIWGGNYYSLPPSRCWLIWYKPDAPPSMADLEMAWVSRDGNAKHFKWSIAATNAERAGHPTQKPLALMKWCIGMFPEALSVLDPYMGSGTSLVAAKDMGIIATGIEREEAYCEIAANRLRQSVLAFE